jgi:acetylglutamate synthase
LFRNGSTILHFSEIAEVDRARLVHLLEASFGKKLKDESFLSNVQEAYIEKDYRGAVLLERHEAGLYLSKFAVGREARGEGLALELWQKVSESHASIFWRSNASNPFNSWYQQQADGQHRSGKWQIFWRGILIENISGVIEFCCIRDEDFAGPRTA